MAYVTPAQDMLVRAGQHVSSDGRVYHPYLAQWGTYWDKSSIFDFLAVLRGVFAKEPPVIAKQQVHQQPVQQAPPPPVPPPPEEWRTSQQPQAQLGLRGGDYAPPPLPPKGADAGRGSTGPSSTRQFSGQNGPPLPPLPPIQSPLQQYAPQNQNQWQHGRAGIQYQAQQPQPQRQSSLNVGPSPYTPQQQQLPPHMRFQQNPHELESPVSPITPDAPNTHWQRQQPPDPRSYQQGQAQPPNYAQQVPPPQRKPQPAIDLLTSPFDVTLPSQNGPVEPLPVPPVPPNPQKDALLNALSQTLV